MVDVYATPEEVANASTAGVIGDPDAMARACIIATAWVADRVGEDQPADELAPPYTVTRVPCPAAWTLATITLAARFLESPQNPLGIAGQGEMTTYIRTSAPDVDLILFGHRRSWGIA